ncbi:hypothetical protein GCM10009691_19830 [Brevibacterium picturae]|uniref:Uncharacterized protein n=1 Tax=Brevibacterium picturae TaxID=260553 RepID=A0ABN2BSP2_9MICO
MHSVVAAANENPQNMQNPFVHRDHRMPVPTDPVTPESGVGRCFQDRVSGLAALSLLPWIRNRNC